MIDKIINLKVDEIDNMKKFYFMWYGEMLFNKLGKI